MRTRVFRSVRPHSRAVTPAVFAIIVGQALATVCLPLTLGYAVDAMVARDSAHLLLAIGAYAGITIGTVASTYVEWRSVGSFGQDYLASLRRSLIRHLLFLDQAFFEREPSGRLIARVTSDVDNLQLFVDGGLSIAQRAALTVTLTIATMLAQSWQLTVAILVLSLPLAGATEWFRRQAFPAQLRVRDSVARLLTQLNESFNGVRVVQAYAAEEYQRAAFETVNVGTFEAKVATAGILARYYPLVEFLQPVALAIVLGVGGLLYWQGRLRLGAIITFIVLVGQLFVPLMQITELNNLLQAATASFAKIFGFLEERPDVTDKAKAAPLRRELGEIRLEHVGFRYAQDKPEVLRDVDLILRPGERVALVGGSGAGKSTLAKLIARVYDPTRGSVTIDGQDLRDIQQESLRKAVALLPQEGFLFDGTVADNIRVVRPDASRAAVEEICERLEILEHLRRLPNGLDTHVSSHGLSLSAGQRQLVSLARAAMADPMVLVLDEATSNVDPASELAVDRALRRLLSGRTCVVIAHRIATAMQAERVIILAGGVIVEDGPPAVLTARGVEFRD